MTHAVTSEPTKTPSEDAVPLPIFEPRPDIRLIAADMDGTLLDDDKELHDHFWPLAEALIERGIHFCPASGRQYASLFAHFGPVADRLLYIAENGAYVVRGRSEISSDTLDPALVERLVVSLRAQAEAGGNLGVVVCGKRSAYFERTDRAFLDQAGHYYASGQAVADLLDRPEDDILKVAVYDFVSAEEGAAAGLAAFRSEAQVVVSGTNWVDIQNLDTNKATALRAIQRSLGITADQTMVFGDFLNDLEMMDAATYSFAMHNAHPLLRERATYVAPPNSENGVVRTISAVLDLPWTAWP